VAVADWPRIGHAELWISRFCVPPDTGERPATGT
jgi:hypothetical protein